MRSAELRGLRERASRPRALLLLLLLASGCRALDSIPYTPPTTPAQWCLDRPCVDLGGTIWNEPLGTFLVNVSGSFLLGVVGTLITERLVPSADTVRLALGVGFLGAFTTFSTFEFETHALIEDGSWLTAFANVFLSLFVGLLAVRAGIVVASATAQRGECISLVRSRKGTAEGMPTP